MNLIRFLCKCTCEPAAAWRSIKLVTRSLYGRLYWGIWPDKPLRLRFRGAVLLLEPHHSFTHCFWPAIENYEPDVCAALVHFLKPGSTFVDCGSNIGWFSVVANSIVGPSGAVLAIEANPKTFCLLQRNLEANGIRAGINCALVAEPKTVRLFVPRRGGDVYSSLKTGGLVDTCDVSTFEVNGRTLDDVIISSGIKRVDVLKIDIEGGELDVLLAATYVLTSMRPIVICEYGTNTWPAFGATPAALLSLLTRTHYRAGVFDTQRHTIIPVSDAVWQLPYANLILQPENNFHE